MSARDQIAVESHPTVIGRAVRDFIGRTRNASVLIRRHPLRSVLWALGLVRRDLASNAQWTLASMLADEAEDDRLDAQLELYGLTRRAAAAVATCDQLRFTGVAATLVPIGTAVERADGVTYTTDADANIDAGGSVDVAATCNEAGDVGNLDAGGTVTLVNAIADIDDAVIVVDGFTGGTDAETNDAGRVRLLARIREEPDGGTQADYRAWIRAAFAAGTVRAAWMVVGAGALNYRDVYFSIFGLGDLIVPSTAQVTTAQMYVDTLRPVTHNVTVRRIAGVALALTIDLDPDAADPDTDSPDLREAVLAELSALTARIAGRRDADGLLTVANSEIRNAIGRGATIFTLSDVNGDGTGLSDVSYGAGAFPIASVAWA